MIRRSLNGPVCLGLAVCLVLCGLSIQGASGKEVYVVQLSQPSLVEQVLDWGRGRTARERRRMLESLRARQYLAQVQAGQLNFVQTLDQSGLLRTAGRPQGAVEVLERRSYLVNMLVVRASEKDAKGLRRFSEVRGVYENAEFRPHMDTAPGLLGAPAAWEAVGGQETAGAGIRIGVIDSGINHLHIMFRPDGLTAPAGFPRRRTDFTNAKVIVAENYVRTSFGYNEQDEQSPRPEFGHGTQVAGVAAGRPADSPLAHLSGIAPGAFLGNYKVFGDPGVNSSARLAGLLAALNDAVADGMDVINMSLGGGIPANPEQNPFSIAISDAVSLGTVVVLSAGNEGPDDETISWPGILPDVLTVGSVSNGRVFARILAVAADMLPEGLSSIAYLPGQGVAITQDLGPLPLRSVLQADPTELACSPLPPGSLSGMVLVRRGDCLFVDKSANVFAAGAQAMVVYNNQGEPFGMAAPEGTSFSLPSVMISQSAGEGLRDFLAGDSANATLLSQIMALPAQADEVSGFSSRGPNFQSAETGIKPDVVAIGERIHISTAGASDYVTSTQGTSFSAPMLAGGAALVLQEHPGWDAQAVKSALVNTAVRSPTLNGAPAGVLERGNGRLDLSRALDPPVVLDPTGFSFGTIAEVALSVPAGFGSPSLLRQMRVRNLGDSPLLLEAEAVAEKQVPGFSPIVFPNTFQLGAGESEIVNLRLLVAGAGLGQGEFEGYVRIRDSAGQMDVRAAYWGLSAVGLDDSIVLRVAQDGSQPFADLTEALRQAGPGNVIEIQDSGRYFDNLVIDGSGFRRRDGITLRAAAGEAPVLEGSVEVSNVAGVTLQGLTFANSVEMSDAGAAVRDSFFGASASLSLRSGAYHVYGNKFDTDEGVGLFTQSASALVQFNDFGREGRETPSQAGAVQGTSSLLSIFDNAILDSMAVADVSLGPEEAAAAAFYFSPAILIKGNTAAGTREGPAVRSRSVGDLVMINNLIRDSQGPGISLANFSLADLRFGTLEANRGAGVEASGGSILNAHALRLQGNASGLLAEGSSLTVSDSLVADSSSGSGIGVLGGQLQVRNSTVTGNSGRGILAAGATGVIANSILFANSAGDLSPSAEPLASGQGNSAGTDPLFANPPAGDFSLSPGSPAIDAGNSSSLLSPTDLEGHRRVAGAAVDQGALESGSDYAPGLILPVLSTDAAEFVGVAMTNAHRPPGSPSAGVSPGGAAQASGASVEMRAYDSQGELYDRFNTDLAPESQFSILLSQAFEMLRPGWVEIASTRPDLLSFSLLGRPAEGGLEFLDGAALAGAQAGPLLLPEVRNAAGEDTWIYIVNPSDQANHILIEWVPADGSVRQQTRDINARGMFSATLRELFGEGTRGLIRLTSPAEQPFCAMEIFGTARSRGGLSALEASSASDTLYGAQLAMGPDIETYIQVIPLQPAPLVFEAYDESGQLAASVALDNIQAATSYRLRAKELFDLQNSFVGWLRVRSEAGLLLGSLSFEDPQGDFLAALPLQAEGAREFVLSHVAENDQIFTGLTLLNPLSEPTPFPTTAAVSVEIFDSSGTRVGLALLTLATGEKRARLLSELAPQLGRRDSGFVRIRSSLPVLGFELFGNNASTFLSAVPAQRLVR